MYYSYVNENFIFHTKNDPVLLFGFTVELIFITIIRDILYMYESHLLIFTYHFINLIKLNLNCLLYVYIQLTVFSMYLNCKICTTINLNYPFFLYVQKKYF